MPEKPSNKVLLFSFIVISTCVYFIGGENAFEGFIIFLSLPIAVASFLNGDKMWNKQERLIRSLKKKGVLSEKAEKYIKTGWKFYK